MRSLKPDCGEFVLGARQRSAAPASSSGMATFSSAVMVGIRWKDWKTMPIVLPRKRASRVLVELARVLSGDLDRAAVRALQSGHHHQQRRFAGARGTERGRPPRPTYIEGDVAQDMDAGGAAAERQIDAAEYDGVAGERMPRNVVHASSDPDPANRPIAPRRAPAHMGGGGRSPKSPRFVAWRCAAATGDHAARAPRRRSILSRSAIP